MAIFDPKQVVVLLDGREISDWSDGSDVINATNQVDAGQNGSGHSAQDARMIDNAVVHYRAN